MIKFDSPITIHTKSGIPDTVNFLDPIYFDYPDVEMYYCQFATLNCPPIMLFIKDTYTRHITSEIAEKKLLELLADNPQKFLQNHIENYKPIHDDTITLYPDGPGTILHSMLSKLGIQTNPNCKCMAKANHMNLMGPDWCERNIDLIVSWLKEESKNRKLPFIESLAKLLVKRSISKSRKLQKK